MSRKLHASDTLQWRGEESAVGKLLFVFAARWCAPVSRQIVAVNVAYRAGLRKYRVSFMSFNEDFSLCWNFPVRPTARSTLTGNALLYLIANIISWLQRAITLQSIFALPFCGDWTSCSFHMLRPVFVAHSFKCSVFFLRNVRIKKQKCFLVIFFVFYCLFVFWFFFYYYYLTTYWTHF